MNGTPITFIGNVTAEPDLREHNGKPVVQVRVASTERFFNKQSNEWEDGATTYLSASLWGKPAENVATSIVKGMKVIVVGTIGQRDYETRDGEKRTNYEIRAEEIAPSLTFGSVTFHKGGAGGGAPQGGGGYSPRGGGQQSQSQQSGGWGGPQEDEPPF